MGRVKHPRQGRLIAEAGSQVREAMEVTSVLERGQMNSLRSPFEPEGLRWPQASVNCFERSEIDSSALRF